MVIQYIANLADVIATVLVVLSLITAGVWSILWFGTWVEGDSVSLKHVILHIVAALLIGSGILAACLTFGAPWTWF